MTYIFFLLVIEIVNIIFDANYYVPRFSKVFPRYTAFFSGQINFGGRVRECRKKK